MRENAWRRWWRVHARVGRRIYRDFHADVAARPAAVVDDYLLAQTLREFFAEHAALNIGRAAGDTGYDKADGFVGVVAVRECRIVN